MEIRKIERLTKQRWLNLFNIEFFHKGKLGSWQFASRKELPEPGTGPLVSDAVIIVPILRSEKKLVVIREFRFPLGDYEYSFPAGLPDKGESLEETAKRELKEETGLEVTKINRISPPLVSSAGLSDESVTMVFVDCEGEISNSGQDVTEDIEVHLLDYEGVSRLCNSREKISAKTWPVLLMFQQMGAIL